MSDIDNFIVPLQEDLETPAGPAFPDLPQKSSEWLSKLLIPELQNPDEERETRPTSRYQVCVYSTNKLRSLDLPCFQYTILFRSGLWEAALDPSKLQSEKESFDWNAFFESEQRTRWLVEQEDFFLLIQLPIWQPVLQSWRKISPEQRSRLYNHPRFLEHPEWANFLEDLPLETFVPPTFWHWLNIGKDSFHTSLRLLVGDTEGITPEALEFITSIPELRQDILRGLEKPNHEVLALLSNSQGFLSIAQDILDILDGTTHTSQEESPLQIINTGPQSALDSQYIEELFKFILKQAVEESADNVIWLLSKFLPLNCERRITLARIEEENAIPILAGLCMDLVTRPDILPRIEQLLRKCDANPRRHDSFSLEFLKQLDDWISEAPSVEKAFLFAFWVLHYSNDSSDPIFGLNEIKSLSGMVRIHLSEEPDLSGLFELNQYCRMEPGEESAWASRIIQELSALSISATRTPLHVSQLSISMYAFASSGFESSTPTFFGNPLLGLAKRYLESGVVDRICGIYHEEDISHQIVLAAAIILGIPSALQFIETTRKSPDRPSLYLQVVYLLSRNHTSLYSDQDRFEALQNLNNDAIYTPEFLRFFSGDERRAIEWAIQLHFHSFPNDIPPSFSDFRSKYSELLFEKSSVSNLQVLRTIAENVLIPETLRRMESIIAGDSNPTHSGGLELAAFLLQQKSEIRDTNNGFAKLCMDAAQIFLDRMRKRIRQGSTWEDLSISEEAIGSAAEILSILKGTWPAVKQLLTIFRHISFPSLDSSLDPWSGINARTWGAIPQKIHSLLDRVRKPEDGRILRSLMTHDLLEHLKPRKGETPGNLVEPNEIWRYAYIRALGDLGADPKDARHFHHQVLDKCAITDPSGQVRIAAKEASDILRTRTGWKSGSSKRMLLHAWWWIRQAHMITLKAEIDRAGALRRRESETRI